MWMWAKQMKKEWNGIKCNTLILRYEEHVPIQSNSAHEWKMDREKKKKIKNRPHLIWSKRSKSWGLFNLVRCVFLVILCVVSVEFSKEKNLNQNSFCQTKCGPIKHMCKLIEGKSSSVIRLLSCTVKFC